MVSASFSGQEGKGQGCRMGLPPSAGMNASSKPLHSPSITAFHAAPPLRGRWQPGTSSLTPWQSDLNWI